MKPNLAVPWLLLTPALPAQHSEGPFLAVAHGLSVDQATTSPSGGPGAVLFSPSGFTTSPPGAWAPLLAGLPDFGTVLAGAGPGIDADAMSLGLDWILADQTGQVAVPPGSWGAITLSVTRSTVGQPGSIVASEATAPDGAAADVFAYVLPGSQMIPAALVGATGRAQDSTENGTSTGGATGNIDAHDVYLGLVYLENPQLVPFLPPTPPFATVPFFFSVTSASLPAVPTQWWAGSQPSGATVLVTTWDPANPGCGGWCTPQPFLLPGDLGLQAGDDVDALAIDLLRAHLLFSTTSGNPDPLLYARIGTSGNLVFHEPNGMPVSASVGLNPPATPVIDDVDGICALDPGPIGLRILRNVLGSPAASVFPAAPSNLGASVFRRSNPNGVDLDFVSFMTGWPPPGAPAPGVAVAAVSLGLPAGPYSTVAFFPRPVAGNAFQGHPHRYVLTAPPNPAFSGLPVWFVWGAIDTNTGAFDLSLPVGLVF